MFFPRQVRLRRIPPLTRSLAVAVDDGPTWVLHGDGTGEPDRARWTPPSPARRTCWSCCSGAGWGWTIPRLHGDRIPEAAATVLGAGLVP